MQDTFQELEPFSLKQRVYVQISDPGDNLNSARVMTDSGPVKYFFICPFHSLRDEPQSEAGGVTLAEKRGGDGLGVMRATLKS